MSHTRLHTCRIGDERSLREELARVFPGSRHAVRGPGWVESALAAEDAALTPTVALAAQCLPDPEAVLAPSIAAWARRAADFVVARLADSDVTWRLHVFCVEEPGSAVRGRRVALIEAEIAALLKRRHRRLLRRCTASFKAPFLPGEHLVQVALETPTAGWIALTPPDARSRLRRCLSRFPGGWVAVPEDPAPPSRAYRKLLEVELRLGRPIGAGERCVDLGAAPGGWTHVALGRGASVVAVDRSPLRADLMAHPRLAFVRGDGFAYAPGDPPVDWLLSDIAAFPERVLGLLERWVGGGLCRRFCVTVKLSAAAGWFALEPAKRILEGSGAEFEVRRLTYNRNEVTVFGGT